MTCRSDGKGIPEMVYRSAQGGSNPTDWSSDGKYICATSWGQSFDIVLVDPLDSSDTASVLNESYFEVYGQFSPDGRFLLYQSNESGRYEIYVRELGDGHGKWQVSSDGGFRPDWRADGKEIFYWDAASRLIAVPVDTEAGRLTFGVPERLFERTVARSTSTHRLFYDVSADGQRFYMTVPASDDNQTEFVVVLNWNAELED
jgi:protease II